MRTKKKQLGQIFTNPMIAEFMAKEAYYPEAKKILDPAVGVGALLKYYHENIVADVSFLAYDVDIDMIEEAQKNLSKKVHFENKDYLKSFSDDKFDIIICNPPYNKFQEILERDDYIRSFHKRYNIKLSGYSNQCVYFLIKSLHELNENGRCVYIIPYEFLNTGYGEEVKKFFLDSRFLKDIFKFNSNISLFDDALTTSCILVFERKKHNSINFVTINDVSEISNHKFSTKQVYLYTQIDSKEKWNKYFSSEEDKEYKNLVDFSKLARAKRGIATGGNAFFALSAWQVDELSLSSNVLIKCICKSPDVKTIVFSDSDFNSLLENNKKVFIFDGTKAQTKSDFDYIQFGELNKYNESYLNSHRTPWYQIENKEVAPIWVSVFNRNSMKVIRNETNSRNLTTFHGIYFNNNNIDFINVFFCYLLTPLCMKILSSNKREYGAGLDKFEPNDLNSGKVLDINVISEIDKKKILSIYQKIKCKSITVADAREELNNIFLQYVH